LTSFKNDFDYLIEMKNELINHLQNITHDLMPKVDRISLGTGGIYLNSILANLRGIEIVLEHGLIECGATIAASLWEKCITIIYILNNPIARSIEQSSHQGFKKTPWAIRQMVKDIVNNEELPSSRNKDIEEQLLYFQYSYLCAIKHGNPYTIAYLNRIKGENTKCFNLKPEIVEDDKGLVAWIFGISITSSVDALVAFSKIFCGLGRLKQLENFKDKIASKIMSETNNRKFKFPTIIQIKSNDFTPEYLDYLKKLNDLYLKNH